MQKEIDIKLTPREAHSEENIRRKVASAERIDESRIQGIRILKRSIDARQKTGVDKLDTPFVYRPKPSCPNLGIRPYTLSECGAETAGNSGGGRTRRLVRLFAVDRAGHTPHFVGKGKGSYRTNEGPNAY